MCAQIISSDYMAEVFVWLLPGNDMSAAAPLLLSCWFCVLSIWFASSFCTCPSQRCLVLYY